MMNKMGNKKNLIIVIITLVIVMLSAVIINKIIRNYNLDYELEQITEIDYFLMSDNDKYGVIDKNGKVIIEPNYESVQIPNPQKPVFVCLTNYDESTNEYESIVLNEKGERILYQYVSVEAIYIGNMTSDIPYEKSVLKYKENGKWGLIDFNGKKISKPVYDEIAGLEYKEGLLLIKKDNKYGVINIKGASVIKNKYDLIQCDGYYSKENSYNKAGFLVAQKTNEGYRYGYINYKGKLILDTKYNELDRILDKKDDENAYFIAFQNGRAGLLKNKDIIMNYEYDDMYYNSENDLLIPQKNLRQGVSDLNGNLKVQIEYDNIIIAGKYINAQKGENVELYNINGEKQENDNYISINQTANEQFYIVITSDEKYEILDEQKNILVDGGYSYISHISEDYFMAIKNNMTGIIDSKGKVVVDFKYNIMQKIGETTIMQGLNLKSNTTDLYDFSINKIASMQKANIYLKNEYIILCNENNVEYYSNEGKKLENIELFNNTLFAIKQNNKWGFADKNGNVVVKPIYDMVTEFNSYGYAGVKLNGKWGSINANGEIIVEPVYDVSSVLPEFIGEYYKYDLGYGEPYYTKNLQIKIDNE